MFKCRVSVLPRWHEWESGDGDCISSRGCFKCSLKALVSVFCFKIHLFFFFWRAPGVCFTVNVTNAAFPRLPALCLLEFNVTSNTFHSSCLSGLCPDWGCDCSRWVSPHGSSVPKRDFTWNLAYALNIHLLFISSTYLKVVFLIFTVNINSSAVKNCSYAVHSLSLKVFHNCVCDLLRGGWFSIFVNESEFFESQRCFCITAVKELWLLVQYLGSFTLMSLTWLWSTRYLFHYLCLCNSLHWVCLAESFLRCEQISLLILASTTGFLSAQGRKIPALFCVCLKNRRHFYSLLS